MLNDTETFCVGCGCTDMWGCAAGCSWVRLADRYRVGICSNCMCRETRRRLRRWVRALKRQEAHHG
jgi:hypothetical protein